MKTRVELKQKAVEQYRNERAILDHVRDEALKDWSFSNHVDFNKLTSDQMRAMLAHYAETGAVRAMRTAHVKAALEAFTVKP